MDTCSLRHAGEAGGEMSTKTAHDREGATARHGRPGRWRRWWRRRPVRKALVLTHRWTSLVLGLLLVVESTSGAIVLYQPEWFRTTHDWFYRHTASPEPISAQRAVDTVTAAHPGFDASWVSYEGGIYAVGDSAYAHAFSVDPGTGSINGFAELHGGTMGLLANLHDCAFTCPAYPGYLPALAEQVPLLGLSWGALSLVVLGLLMVLLVVTGIIVWWPGIRKFSRGFRLRLRKGRFARDYDLHNIIGLIGAPLLLMWGVTGAAFELPAVKDAWVVMTGGRSGEQPAPRSRPPSPANGPVIGVDAAVRAASAATGGEVVYVQLPPGEGPGTYSVSLTGAYSPYEHRALFGGDATAAVDSHDPTNVSTKDSADQPAANAFYDEVFEPAHFGWMVNGWWRILWFALGMTPAALAATGLSTWLFRRRTRRRRRRASGRAEPIVRA